MMESEVLQFKNGPTAEPAGNSGDDGMHMLKHAGDITLTLPKTLDFSPLSEFSVGADRTQGNRAQRGFAKFGRFAPTTSLSGSACEGKSRAHAPITSFLQNMPK
jgi:hypothetical protein